MWEVLKTDLCKLSTIQCIWPNEVGLPIVYGLTYLSCYLPFTMCGKISIPFNQCSYPSMVIYTWIWNKLTFIYMTTLLFTYTWDAVSLCIVNDVIITKHRRFVRIWCNSYSIWIASIYYYHLAFAQVTKIQRSCLLTNKEGTMTHWLEWGMCFLTIWMLEGDHNKLTCIRNWSVGERAASGFPSDS